MNWWKVPQQTNLENLTILMRYGLSEGHKRGSLYDLLSGSATSCKRLSTPTFIPLWIHKISYISLITFLYFKDIMLQPRRITPSEISIIRRMMIRKPNAIIVFYYSFKIIPSLKQARTCLPPPMLSSNSIVHVNRQVKELKQPNYVLKHTYQLRGRS